MGNNNNIFQELWYRLRECMPSVALTMTHDKDE